ncbi:GNAT family N-acetyltransferase [Mesorhizobium marinum]|uniref:GNAT family N-acetyltransferase n=1 Tax=Mesorhizobium marinum TaxID=3228790 RepID=UPI003467E3B3
MILDLGGGFVLRHALAADHEALCRVCLMTGDAGADASAREDDPTLMGQIYAVPYQVLEPDLAFVLEGEPGVSGYLFGALDTAAFYARLEADWYPALRRHVRDPGQDRTAWRNSDWARHAIHHPSLDVPDSLADFPSHGHIDLLPEARGRGVGRRCVEFLEGRLAKAGSTGLFLDVHPRNRGAQRFYAALGYRPVAGGAGTSMFMAKRL